LGWGIQIIIEGKKNMKKPMRNRIISSFTSAVLAMSYVIPDGLPRAGEMLSANAAVGPIISVGADDIGNSTNVNKMPVEIRFRTAWPKSEAMNNEHRANVTTEDNLYYLLVHAVGADEAVFAERGHYGTPGNYQYDDDNRDFYKLIEINADNQYDWVSDNLDIFEVKTTEYELWGGMAEADVVPKAESVEITIVKNNDTSVDLAGEGIDINDILNETICTNVDTINGMDVIPHVDRDSGQSMPISSDWNGSRFMMDANGGHTVEVNFYDYDGTTLAPVDTDEHAKYYVLAKLEKDGKVVAYSSTEIRPEENAASKAYLFEFKEIDSDGLETGKIIQYNPEEYNLVLDATSTGSLKDQIRVYHTMKSDQEITCYAFYNDASVATDEMIKPYIITKNSTEGKTTVIEAKKEHVTYDLKLRFDEQPDITADDKLVIMLDTEHQSGNHTYFYKLVDTSDIQEADGVYEYTINVQDSDNAEWVDENGSKAGRFSGGEKSVTARLFRCNESTPRISILLDGTCPEIKAGQMTSGYTFEGEVNESSDPCGDSVTEDEEEYTKAYTYTVSFKKASIEDEYTLRDILGNGLLFGITADRYNQNAHAQTNFATNYYEQPKDEMQPNLTGNTAGNFAIANYADFDNGNVTTIAEDKSNVAAPVEVDSGSYRPGQFRVGEWGDSLTAPTIYVPDAKSVGPTSMVKPNREDGATVVEMKSEDISEQIVEPIIDHMKQMSETLKNHPQNITPDIIGSKMIIDGSRLPDGAEIYIDADEYLDYFKGSANTLLKLKRGQTVIFNFDGEYTEQLEIGRVDLEYVDVDINGYDKVDEISRSALYNFYSVKDVNIAGSSGIFLNPNPDSEMVATQQSDGWVITDGYFENRGIEWHFNYKDLQEESPVVEKSASVAKQDRPCIR
jgi:hypothetical protein